MDSQRKKITLGFTDQSFDAGVHICQIFNDDSERHDALINYVISGVKTNEKVACFSENENPDSLSDAFAKQGLEYKEVTDRNGISLSKTAEVYFEGDRFDPERMLSLLEQFYKGSQPDFEGARVIGEMTSEVEHINGGSRLLEYESKVSLLLKKYPVTAVCQYDARSFNGSTIMDILKVHPYMIIKGAVVNNPFFIKPEDYLEQNNIS